MNDEEVERREAANGVVGREITARRHCSAFSLAEANESSTGSFPQSPMDQINNTSSRELLITVELLASHR